MNAPAPNPSNPTRKAPFRQRFGREAIKWILDPLLRWKPLPNPEPGFSILLGVPWDLRHLLLVNLQFVAKTDTTNLRELFVVFDRTERPGAEKLIEDAKRQFPNLPLTFRFHNPLSGWICEKVNVSTFYNSMNTVLALSACKTKYMILHDFDLYPLVPNYFTAMIDAMTQRDLRFCGLEHTPFDGLTEADNLLGTWALGIDVPWIRKNYRPIQCFHRVAPVNGRLINLDPYSYLQTKTPQRGLIETIDGSACCHVKNLCSTFLRFKKGVRPNFVWRLHYLWYLEYNGGQPQNLELATQAMKSATSSKLSVGDYTVDFFDVHWTSANVLRDELNKMESFLHGQPRAEVTNYVEAFAEFLKAYGAGREETKNAPAQPVTSDAK